MPRNNTAALLCLLLGAASPAWSQVDGKLEDRFLEPPGAEWGSFVNADGATIRTFHLKPAGEIKATMLIATGLNEYAEKYFEMMRDVTRRGIDIWQMDWRGQGASQRYLDNRWKRTASDFANDIRDFKQFRDTVAKPAPGKPVLLHAHSMGGNIMLRYLAQHPEDFAAAFVTAPLVELNTGGVPLWALRGLSWTMVAIGLGESYKVGDRDWVVNPAYAVGDSGTSQDPVRYKVHVNWYVRKPELQIGGLTWRWLDRALASTAELQKPETLAAITTPVTLISAGIDVYVLHDRHDWACARMKACTLVKYADAKHEPWMEKDEIRQRLIGDFDAFLARSGVK